MNAISMIEFLPQEMVPECMHSMQIDVVEFAREICEKNDHTKSACISKMISAFPENMEIILNIISTSNPRIWSFVIWDLLRVTFGNMEGGGFSHVCTHVSRQLISQGNLSKAFVGIRSEGVPDYILNAIREFVRIDPFAHARLAYWLPTEEMMEIVKKISIEIFFIPSIDCMHLGVIMKYLVIGENSWGAHAWNRAVVEKLINGCCALLMGQGMIESDYSASRFSLIQLMGIIPEVVPSGLLLDLKSHVLMVLARQVDQETSMVVRRQLAVTMTNWYSLA